MTGTEPHAPRGTAGRGPNWDRGPRAGHAGAARRCKKRHRLCGLNRDHGPCTGRGSFASTDAHLGTAGREALCQWGPLAASGPEELRDSERTYASTHAYLGTAGRGLRAGRRSCVTRSGHIDVDVTQ
jgi:hypothetical protein